MLEKLSNKLVRGEYFTVRVPDIHKVEYIEGKKIAAIEIEGTTDENGGVKWLIYTQTFRGWLPPNDSEEISSERREQIFSNVSKCLTLLEMQHTILNH